MQERQVTVDGESRPLPAPFLVAATQNPIEYEGTYPLPEAQLDRFLFRIDVGYPDEAGEEAILRLRHRGVRAPSLDGRRGGRRARTTSSAAGALIDETTVSDEVADYLAAVVRRTRELPAVELGASPRAAVHLLAASRAAARLAGPRVRDARRRRSPWPCRCSHTASCCAPRPSSSASPRRRRWPRRSRRSRCRGDADAARRGRCSRSARRRAILAGWRVAAVLAAAARRGGRGGCAARAPRARASSASIRPSSPRGVPVAARASRCARAVPVRVRQALPADVDARAAGGRRRSRGRARRAAARAATCCRPSACARPGRSGSGAWHHRVGWRRRGARLPRPRRRAPARAGRPARRGCRTGPPRARSPTASAPRSRRCASTRPTTTCARSTGARRRGSAARCPTSTASTRTGRCAACSTRAA